MGWGILAVIFGVAAGLFPQVGPLCLLAALYIVFKILMRRRPKGGRTVLTFLCWNALNAIFRENEGLPLLSFVLSIAWIILAIREIYFYFRDKKAAKD